ncbi:hypothetical protein D3OALGA1CA_1396 [Olavius algarvensis associated proteobacterium Delta 3]|nr:hypothetical protein D3OALGB2SA_843 [Olavius algarvensis associated proteobacterium Delta 3]CAB5100704.1 hypothetical protein D3OALGA1CA_1396 [Olavius algarvensis associated proteobacterium Delta 3]
MNAADTRGLQRVRGVVVTPGCGLPPSGRLSNRQTRKRLEFSGGSSAGYGIGVSGLRILPFFPYHDV